MTKDEVKDVISKGKGYPNWKAMYDWVSRDGQKPEVVAQLIEAATEEAMEQYANQKALQIASEAWDESGKWAALPRSKETFLSNLKKKIEA